MLVRGVLVALNEPHQFDIAMNSTFPQFVKIPIFSDREKVYGLKPEVWGRVDPARGL